MADPSDAMRPCHGPRQAEGRVEKLEEKLQAKRDAIQELQDAWLNSGKSTINISWLLMVPGVIGDYNMLITYYKPL